MVDGDDTYSAKHMNDLLEPVKNFGFDLVIGDRLTNSTNSDENERNFHEPGSKLFKTLINKLYKLN